MAKTWAWSYSRLKNYEICPYRHLMIDLEKKFAEPKPDPKDLDHPLSWGDYVHKGIEAFLKNGTPLPDTMAPYQKWVDGVTRLPGKRLVEQQYALTKNFTPSPYFGPAVWLRVRADCVVVNPPWAVAVDWKTGKFPKDGPDETQLMLVAQCVFANFPEVKRVASQYIWLQEDTDTSMFFSKQDLADGWFELMPRVTAMENAWNTKDYPQKPSGLCVRSCVVTSCPFHGKGNPR